MNKQATLDTHTYANKSALAMRKAGLVDATCHTPEQKLIGERYKDLATAFLKQYGRLSTADAMTEFDKGRKGIRLVARVFISELTHGGSSQCKC